MSDTEQCIECIANCALFICEILCFCCFTDSNWCVCCNSCNESSIPHTNNARTSNPSRSITIQPTRTCLPTTPQQTYYPSNIMLPPTTLSEDTNLLSPTKDDDINDLPPSYEEATKGTLIEPMFKDVNDTK